VTARSAKVREALAWLERRGSKRIREEMLTRYGITAPKAFGMSVSARSRWRGGCRNRPRPRRGG